MEAMELLERVGRVEPVDPEVLARTARVLQVEMANEKDHRHRNRRIRPRAYVAAAAAAIVLVGVVVSVANLRNSPAAPPVRPPVNGSPWRLVSSVTSPFRSLAPGGQTNLQCVTDRVCYSPGSGAQSERMYRTTDGGRSWHETAPIAGLIQQYDSSFSCSNADTCAVVFVPDRLPAGKIARFALTTDGGTRWSTSTIPTPTGVPGAYRGQLACADGTHCVVSVGGTGGLGTFLSTADGGKTWTQATSVPAAPAGAVWTMTCDNDGSCVAVSAMGDQAFHHWIVGLRSDNWGMTWVAGPASVANHGALLYASCADATHCMIVPTGAPSGYEIATTSDGGMTWRVSGPPSGWLNMPTTVACATGNDCWIAMSYYSSKNPAGSYSEPTIEQTHDGGVSWSTIPLPTSRPPISDVLTLSCPPSGDGCMGIGNRRDHFVMPLTGPKGRPLPPKRLSGPLVISNLPPG